MNFLVIFAEEIESERNEIVFQGERARYLRTTHSLEINKNVPCVLLGKGCRGQALVTVCERDQLQLRIEPGQGIAAEALVGIVAVARPPTMRRILFQGAMLGLAEIHIVRAELTDKSYLQSKVLTPDLIRRELLSGLEQSGSCHLPKVVVHHRFLEIKDYLQNSGGTLSRKVVADVNVTHELTMANMQKGAGLTAFAVGPERGWNEFELRCFEEQEFQRISLGPRVLRVDTAFVKLAAKLSCSDI